MIDTMKGGRSLDPSCLMYAFVLTNLAPKYLTHPLSQIRNLSRLIWINVALPPTEPSVPENLKGKVQFTPATTAGQLRKQKQDVVKLCLGYAFAVKHYLRGEDGLDWDDYLDVLPTSFLKHGYNDRTTSENRSLGSSLVAPSPDSSSASASRIDDGRETPDATKRIRVKRSKPSLSRRSTLLEGSHWHEGYSAIDVHADITMPLPLMCAFSYRLSWDSVDSGSTASHTKFLVHCSRSSGRVFWKTLVQLEPTRCKHCSCISLSTDKTSLIGFV